MVYSLQECWEHERISPRTRDAELSYPSWMGGDHTLNLYGSNFLTSEDPPHFVTKDGVAVNHPKDCIVEEGFVVIRKWNVAVEKLRTDDSGWLYGASFNTSEWRNVSAGDHVRKRIWNQLAVDVSQEERVARLLEVFHSRFRSINPWFIERALHGFEYEIQTVVQNQRLLAHGYSGHHLTTADPPEWAQATLPNARCSDICLSRISELAPINRSLFVIAEDWHTLHDFMYVVYPSRDETGWQYASDYQSGEWTAYSTDTSCVRRRVWMRTLVDGAELQACRDAFYRYIQTHPRGSILSLPIQRQSHYRKRWCNGHGTLTDDRIDITLEHNYQQNVSYHLKGCEVLSLTQRDHHLNQSGDNKYFLFGLRRIGGAVILGKIEDTTDDGMVCVLNALSGEDREKWVDALAHQLVLTNGHFYSHSDLSSVYGPPELVDIPYFSGRLMKKGKVLWKERVFELRKSGVFAYYKRGVLIGEINVAGCSVRIPHKVSCEYPFEVVNSEGDMCLLLAAHDPLIRDAWMTALRSHITATNEGGAAFWYNIDPMRSTNDTLGDRSTEEASWSNDAASACKYHIQTYSSFRESIDSCEDNADRDGYLEGEGPKNSSFVTLHSDDLEGWEPSIRAVYSSKYR